MTSGSGRRRRRTHESLRYRPAAADDLLGCAQIWSTAIEDYVRRLNQPWFSGDLQPLQRLLGHCLGTDPTSFVVATDPAAGGRLVGFGSATRRGDVWFLGMLFVLPELQAAGVGRALLEQILPPGARRVAAHTAELRADVPPDEAFQPILGTATDSVQPISNALYSQYGMVPRLPLFNFVGYPERPEAFGAMPAGIVVRESRPETADEDLAALSTVDDLAIGYRHPADHEFLRAEGRRLFVARSERGDAMGYGHIAPSGRFGPVAAVDAELLAPLAGHLVTSVRAPGAYASWVAGSAGSLFVALLGAGFRFESFPTLLLWNRPFGDFSRYVPINLALL